MIGALLSNTPANLLKSSGVAGEPDPGSGENTPGRDRETARDSLASPRAVSLRSNNGPILTPEAVLALQETESAETSGRRATTTDPDRDGEKQGPAETVNGDTSATATDGSNTEQAAVGGQVSAAGQGSGSGEGEKEDADGDGLNEAEEKQVKELAKRDREVRAHEQAHARVGGAYAGAPSYTFQQGPDGKRYAIGGEVQIDTAKERTPEATIRKMQIVIRAATAPAEPSSQDLKVAQQARSQLSEAQAELRQQKAEELQGGDGEGTEAAGSESEPDPSGQKKHADTGTGVENTRSGQSAGSSETNETNETDETDDAGKSVAGKDAISAYQAVIQRANDAQSLFNALVA